jgi:hypothetical protein
MKTQVLTSKGKLRLAVQFVAFLVTILVNILWLCHSCCHKPLAGSQFKSPDTAFLGDAGWRLAFQDVTVMVIGITQKVMEGNPLRPAVGRLLSIILVAANLRWHHTQIALTIRCSLFAVPLRIYLFRLPNRMRSAGGNESLRVLRTRQKENREPTSMRRAGPDELG